jgi:hypothetical protein
MSILQDSLEVYGTYMNSHIHSWVGRSWWPSGKEAWSLPAGGGSITRPAPTPVVASKESRAPGGLCQKQTPG